MSIDGRKEKEGGLTFINIQYQYHFRVIMYNVMLLLTQNNTGINYIKNSNSLYSNVFLCLKEDKVDMKGTEKEEKVKVFQFRNRFFCSLISTTCHMECT